MSLIVIQYFVIVRNVIHWSNFCKLHSATNHLPKKAHDRNFYIGNPRLRELGNSSNISILVRAIINQVCQETNDSNGR